MPGSLLSWMRGRILLLATAVVAAPWEKVGPRNIGDDVRGQGYAGTLADAVSPVANPNLIYTGGHNNGAASGVLKSVDRGTSWVPRCHGLWDTTIASLIILDEAGDHVLAGTPTGIYETLDGASSWRLMPGPVGPRLAPAAPIALRVFWSPLCDLHRLNGHWMGT